MRKCFIINYKNYIINARIKSVAQSVSSRHACLTYHKDVCYAVASMDKKKVTSIYQMILGWFYERLLPFEKKHDDDLKDEWKYKMKILGDHSFQLSSFLFAGKINQIYNCIIQ